MNSWVKNDVRTKNSGVIRFYRIIQKPGLKNRDNVIFTLKFVQKFSTNFHLPTFYSSPFSWIFLTIVALDLWLNFHVNFSHTNFLLNHIRNRLPNGCIDFTAFNKLSAIVSAFTIHMSNVPINSVNCEVAQEYNGIVNHIFTCPLVPENGKIIILMAYQWCAIHGWLSHFMFD